jgi:hypothetical protein
MVSHFGINSYVAAQLFEDLQKARNSNDGPISPSDISVRDYFMALYFLKLYETEPPRASRFWGCIKIA